MLDLSKYSFFIFIFLFFLVGTPSVSADIYSEEDLYGFMDLFGGQTSDFYMPNNKSVFGNFSFDGNCLDGGVEIRNDGTICGQRLEVFNITNLNVTKQNLTITDTLNMLGNLLMGNAAGPAILNEASTLTNPTLIPDRSDLTTGIGSNPSATTVDIIVGGVDTLRFGTAGNMKLMVAGGALRGNNANAGSIINEGSSATNPTLIPNRASEVAGLGGASGEIDLITNSLSRLNIDSLGNISISQNLSVDASTFFVDSNNDRVGIGTASPAARFHITESGHLIFTGDSGSAFGDGLMIQGPGSGGGDLNAQVWNFDNGYLRFATNNVERMRIDNAGDLGIGTTSPSELLHVAGNIFLQNDSDKLYFGQGKDVSINYNGSQTQFTNEVGSGEWVFPTGDVGIGTTSPQELLHMGNGGSSLDARIFLDSGDGDISLSRTMNGIQLSAAGMTSALQKYTPAVKFMSTDSNFITENPKLLAFIVGRATEGYITDTRGGMAMDFATTPNTPGTTSVPSIRMTIDQDGNIGINTTTPSHTLNVVGDLNVTGSIIGTRSEKSWGFTSPSGSSGTFYFDGYYDFGSSDNDFNPSITHGTANSAYAAHLSVICASGATDTEVTVTGTSIQDNGTRVASDTQVLSILDGSANAYSETSKKWIGQVTLEKTAGTDRLCNYGFSKYWDNNNQNLTVIGVEATWLGGANDGGANIILRHHSATGWTYNSGAEPTPPSAIADMNTDHNTEINIVNGENGAWKRTNLNTFVEGNNGEGTIFEIVTSANKAFEFGNIIMGIRNEG